MVSAIFSASSSTGPAQPVEHAINERVIGIGLDDLGRIPNVILAAGGVHKVPVLRGVLGRGFVNTLVSDEITARAVLREP